MVNTAYSLLNGLVLVPVCLCQICPKWSGCVKQYQKQKEDNSLFSDRERSWYHSNRNLWENGFFVHDHGLPFCQNGILCPKSSWPFLCIVPFILNQVIRSINHFSFFCRSAYRLPYYNNMLTVSSGWHIYELLTLFLQFFKQSKDSFDAWETKCEELSIQIPCSDGSNSFSWTYDWLI